MNLFLSLFFLLLCHWSEDPLSAFCEDAKSYEEEIQKLEKLDATENYPEHSLLFVGSSSFRLWDTMHDDMKPWSCIKRGFGGSKFTDIAYFSERLIKPHHYEALVLFSANDVTGKDNDRTPEQIGVAIQRIIDVSRSHQPSAPIFIIAVTPTESRWSVWPRIQASNAMLKDVAKRNSDVHYIDTVACYLNEEGLPRKEFFVDDKLHQNQLGYQTWSSLIKAELSKVLGEPVK